MEKNPGPHDKNSLYYGSMEQTQKGHKEMQTDPITTTRTRKMIWNKTQNDNEDTQNNYKDMWTKRDKMFT